MGAIVERICIAPGDVVEPDQILVELRDDRQLQSGTSPTAGQDQMSKSVIFDALDLDGNGNLSKQELVEVRAAAIHCAIHLSTGSISFPELFWSGDP